MAKNDDTPQALQQRAATGQETPPRRERTRTPGHNPPNPYSLGEGRVAPVVPESEQVEAEPVGAEPKALQNAPGQRPDDYGLMGTGPFDPTAPRRAAEAPQPVKAKDAMKMAKEAEEEDSPGKAAAAQTKLATAEPERKK